MSEAHAGPQRATSAGVPAPGQRRAGRSVFAKLVAVMLAMAVTLLALVAAFFVLYFGPVLNASIDPVIEEYARAVAATAPGYEHARALTRRIDMQIRYEGADGMWTTAADLPAIAEMRGQSRRIAGGGTHYYVVRGPNGGAYLFAWTFTQRLRTVHRILPVVLLLLMAAVILTAHAVLRRLLQPVRALQEGVARLSEGDLDVTVRRRSADEFGSLTDAFNQMVSRIGQMVRSRDQLLLDVSHELRSPVTRLKVALELLPQTEMKGRMAGDLAEMEIMIGELVELERLRSGDGLRPARRNLVPILGEVAARFEDRPPGVRLESAALELYADVDEDRLRIAIRNLLENAVKYSLPNSRPVILSASRDDGRLLISVTDDGPGIPEEDVPNLFEPFFRVDRSRSKKTGGYGLGLSIARRIVEAHGGTLTVRNERPRGASFVITLRVSGQ